MAQRMGIRLDVDLCESRDFARSGPAGCNMCGGIISESLVQILAFEGIDLPDSVVTRGIDAHMLHLDVGSVRIEPPYSLLRGRSSSVMIYEVLDELP